MNETTFKKEVLEAFNKHDVKAIFKVTKTYFGEFDSYAQKDFMPLLNLKTYVENCELQGMMTKSDIATWKKEISTRRDKLIEQLIKEKFTIVEEDYENFLLQSKDRFEFSVKGELDRRIIQDNLQFLNSSNYYIDKFKKALEKYLNLLDEEGLIISLSELYRNYLNDLMTISVEILREKHINHELTHRNNIRAFPQIISYYQLIVNDNIEDLFAIVLKQSLSRRLRPDFCEWMKFYNIHRNLRRRYVQGIINLNDFVEEKSKLIEELTNYIFSGEITTTLKRYESRSFLRKIVDWLDTKVK